MYPRVEITKEFLDEKDWNMGPPKEKSSIPTRANRGIEKPPPVRKKTCAKIRKKRFEGKQRKCQGVEGEGPAGALPGESSVLKEEETIPGERREELLRGKMPTLIGELLGHIHIRKEKKGPGRSSQEDTLEGKGPGKKRDLS